MTESLRIPQTAVAPFDPIGDSIKRRMGLVSRLGDGEFVDPGELAQADVNSMYSGNEFVKGLRRSAYSAGEAAKAYGGQLRELVDPAGGMQMQQEAAQSIRDMPRAWAPKVAEAKDVHSLEDFGSYAAGAIGEGLLTSATALGGTLVGGALGGPAGAWAGGTLPLVPLEGGGQVLDTLNDPVANQKPAWQRALAATGVGALNAGIENINERALVLPSLLGKGITSGMGLKNAAKTVGLSALRSAAGEGMEEGLQDLTGQYALQQLNPQKNIDFGQTLESMAKGAVAGAPMGAAGGSVQALRDNVAPISDSVSESKKPKNEGPLTFDTIIGKLQSVADDPEQFGADVGNMTLNALTEAHKAYDKGVADYKENIAPVVDQGIDYMRKEGIDKAGDIVGKTAMDVNKFIADNIKDPTIRERFIQDASTLGAKTASDWEAFKLTLKAETGKDFQEGLGIAAGRIKDRAKEEAPKTFSWLKDTVKGLYKSVTENSDQKASRFDVDVKGTIERLRGINPVLDNVVKNASINQRRDMAEMMSLGAQNPSLFTEEGIARNPIISEGIRQWNEETGTDFLSVLNAFAKGERDLETRKITGSNVQAFAAENGLGREYVPALQKIAATPIEDLSQDQRSLLETLAKKDSAQKPGTYRMDLSAVAPEGKSPESIYASLVEQTDSVLKREEDRQIREEMGSTPLHAVDYSRMALPDSETETESVLDADGDQVAAYDSDGNRMDIERSNASPFNEKTIAESLADPQYSKSENTRTPITVSGEGVEEFAQSLGKKLNKDGSLTLDISPMSLVSMARQEDNRESFDEHVSEYDDSLSADENAAMRYSNLVATLADKGITFGDKQLNVQIDPKNAFAGGKVIRREKGKDPYNLKKFEEKKTWTPPTSEKLSAEHEALTRFDTASSLEDGIKAQGTKAEKQPLIALKKEVDTLAKKEGISPDQALTKIHAARSETIKKTQVNEEKSALQEALRNGDITQDHVEALADAYDSNALAEAEIDRINEGKFTPEETLKLRKSGKNVDPFGADLIKEINKNREVTIGDGMRVLEGLNRPMLKLSDGSHLRSFIEEGLPTEVAIGSGSDSVDRAAGSEPTQDEKIDSEFEASLGTPMNKEMAVRARSTPSVDPMNVNQVLDFSNRGMHQEALDSAKAVLNNRNTSEEDSIAIREMLPTLEENVQSLPKAPIQEPIQEPIQDPIVQAREAEAQRRFTEEGEYGEKKLSDEQLNTRIAELKTAYKEVRDRYTNEGAGLNPESEWFGDTIGPEAPAELQALLDEQNRRTQETPPSGGEPTDLFGSTPTESKFDSLTKAFNEAKDPRDLLGIGMEVEKAKGELTEEQVGNLRKQFKAARDRLSKSETKVQTTDEKVKAALDALPTTGLKQKTAESWIKKFLGGKGKVRVIEISKDAKEYELLQSAVERPLAKSRGIHKRLGDTNYIVLFRDNQAEGTQLATLAHEFGHAIHSIMWEQLDAKTKNELETAWKADQKAFWGNTFKNHRAILSASKVFGHEAFIDLLKAGKFDEAFGESYDALVKTLKSNPDYGKYLTSFDEWMAEQFNKYVENNMDRAISADERSFWESLRATLQKFFTDVVSKFQPNLTYKQWIEALAAENEKAPGGGEPVDLFGETKPQIKAGSKLGVKFTPEIWKNKKVGDKLPLTAWNNLCLSTSAWTMEHLKKMFPNNTTIERQHFGIPNPGAKSDRPMDHYAAKITIDGKTYLVDTPQNELVKPTPSNTQYELKATEFDPRFIPFTREGLKAAYGLKDTDALQLFMAEIEPSAELTALLDKHTSGKRISNILRERIEAARDGTKALSFTTIRSAITQKLLTEAQAQEYVDLYDGKASPNKEEETQTPPGGGEPVDLFGGTQNSGQNAQKPSNRKPPPPPTPPSGASSPAPKKPRKTPAQKAFVDRVEKLLGKRVAVLFDEALENNAQGSYEDIKKALKDIRDDRRDLLNDKKIDEVADRKTGLTDEEIDAEIKKILAKEQDLIKDKALLGVIKLATGAENNIAHADHESLHAAFEFFFSKEERRILATAFTQGPVAKKLKEYFKNDPGVLAALENGEEAAAYGFQLWVADPSILKVGPKTESLFQKLKDWIYKVLSIMDNNMKAEMIFKDFASGERAKRGATPVQRVLDRNMTTGDKALKLGKDAWAAIEKLYDVIFTASYSRLHNSNIPPLAKIAELGYQAQGVEGNTGGLIQRMRNESQAFQNKVNKILGDLTEEQQLAVHDALIFNRIPTRDPLVKKRAEALRAFYGQMLQYQRNAKVDIGEKKNYYPLAFDPEKVAENKEEFLKMLRQPKYADKMATLMKTPDEIYDSITSYLDRGEDLVDVMGAEKEPVAGHARERTLDFIDVKDRRQFMEDDPVHTAVRYIKQATRQAEFVRAYGVNGAKLEKLIAEAKTRYGATADDEALARDYINGLMGNKEVGMSRELKDLFGALLTYQNLRLLPLAIFSSLVDPLGVAIRTNSVKAGWETFTYSMKNMFKEWKENYTRDQWEQISQDWGIIADSGTVINAYNRYDGMTISGRSKDINDKLFKYNLLSGWIRNNTIMAVKAAQLFMQRSAEDFFGAEQSARYLEELGLTKADIIFSPSLGRIALRANEIKAVKTKMSKEAAQALEEKLRNATEKVVRQSLLNPSSAETPTWVSNPYLAPIAHLKQFVWSFNMTITQRITHEMSHGNFKPALIASLYVPGMIAADFMKDMIVNAGEEPPYKKDWGAVDYLKRGVERSGLTGTGQFFIDSQQDLDWGGGGYESFAGATLQQARKGLKAVGSDNPEAMHKWIVEALPAYKLYDEALL